MPGLLSVVATPIGNLEDVTLRALRVLREADIVAAEDTRHTGKLLRHHGIQARTVSFHAHNTRARLPEIMARLEAGAHVALVTDAGTPGVSDPGVEMVEACRKAGVRIQVIPGASASLTAAVLSGFPLIPLTIFGFPPTRSNDRKRWFSNASAVRHTFTFFEAPHRIEATLRICRDYLVDRHILVARELTKIHEETILFSVNQQNIVGFPARGEFTIVVSPAGPGAEAEPTSDAGILAKFHEVSHGFPASSRRDVVVRVATELGLPRNAIYQALERAKLAE